MIKPSTLIVCESETEDLIGDDPELKEKLDIFKQARYGRACICIFKKKENAEL
jgi:16S rRNA G966 N2-methylase RsmD